MPSAQEAKAKGKTPRRSPTARSGNAIRVLAKDSESYTEILKAMKAPKPPKFRSRGPLHPNKPGGKRSFWS